MAIKPGSSSWLDEEDGDDLENSPLGGRAVERIATPRVAGVKVEGKKRKKIRGRLSPKIT